MDYLHFHDIRNNMLYRIIFKIFRETLFFLEVPYYLAILWTKIHIIAGSISTLIASHVSTMKIFKIVGDHSLMRDKIATVSISSP